MSRARTPAAEYLRFLAWAAAVAGLAAVVGWWPTRRLAGAEALPALLVGCAVSLIASALGGIPVARSRGAAVAAATAPAARLQAMLASMGLRFGVVLVLGVAAAFSGGFERGPLLIWIAIGYVVLLAVDTWYAVKGF